MREGTRQPSLPDLLSKVTAAGAGLRKTGKEPCSEDFYFYSVNHVVNAL